MDSRGTPYGVGSLKETLDRVVSGKRKQPGDSVDFVTLQEQLQEAHKKIEEQAAYNQKRDSEVAAREAEQSRIMAEQKDKLHHLSLVEKYMRQTDPAYLDFVATQSAQARTEPLSTDQSATPPT